MAKEGNACKKKKTRRLKEKKESVATTVLRFTKMMKGFLNALKSSLDPDGGGIDASIDKIDIRDVMELRVRLIHDTSAFIRLPSRACESLLVKAPKFPLPMKVKVIERGAHTSGSSNNNRNGGAPYDIPAHEKEKIFSVIKYVSWAGSTSELGGQIFMDVPIAAARCLGLEDGDLCRVWPVFFAPIAAAVHVSPMRKDDWDVVFAQSDRVEESLLKQLGSAYDGMKFPFFSSVQAGGKPVVLKCTKVEAYVESSENNSKNSQVFPSVVRLAPNTELIVAPPAKEDVTGDELRDGGDDDDDDGEKEEEKMKPFCARVQSPTYHILDELTVKVDRDFKAMNDSIIDDFNCELSGVALLRVSKDKNEQELPCREGQLCRVKIYSEEKKFRNDRSALVRIKYSSHEHLRPGHVALSKAIMNLLGTVQGDTVVLSRGPKPLKVDDFAQVVIQLRPIVVKKEKKKFKIHEDDETSSEDEADGFDSDDSEDRNRKNPIFNDAGLLPKSKPLTAAQILARKLTAPQRIALGLGHLNVLATDESDYDSDDEEEEKVCGGMRKLAMVSMAGGAILIGGALQHHLR